MSNKKEKFLLYFGSNAMSEFLGDRPLTELQDGKFAERLTYADTIRIVYLALKEGARKAKKDFALSFEQVGDLIDENPELPAEAMDVFTKSVQSKEGNAEPGK